MGFWAMYYANLEYKRRHPWIDWDCQDQYDKDDSMAAIITTLGSIGVYVFVFWLTYQIAC